MNADGVGIVLVGGEDTSTLHHITQLVFELFAMKGGGEQKTTLN